MNRRELFTDLTSKKKPREPIAASSGPARLPNFLLRTHHDKPVRFYDDLMRGKQAIINFMYVDCEGACPVVTERLIKVHQTLRDRMGKNLFMYSITLKPEQDDPTALKHFATMHRAADLPGWSFLTGDPFDIETLRFNLFRWDHILFDLDLRSHASMLRIINDATNCWLMVTPYASLPTLLEHIAWADPPKPLKQRLEENRMLQARIKQDVKLYGYRRTV